MIQEVYLFCLTPAEPPPQIEGAGINGLHPLFLETCGGVAAVVSEVDRGVAHPDGCRNAWAATAFERLQVVFPKGSRTCH